MNKSDVHSILVDRLANHRSSTREDVLLDLECAGAIDSLEGLELVIDAEQVFEISISDRELSSGICQSIPELVALIQSKLGPSHEAKGKQEDDQSQ